MAVELTGSVSDRAGANWGGMRRGLLIQRGIAFAGLGFLAACQTMPPPPPPMVQPGLFEPRPGVPKLQTIEFVPIPSTATCKVVGQNGELVGEFTGSRVLSVSLGVSPVVMTCNAPGYLASRREVASEKTQAGEGTGAVIILGILAGPAAAVSAAVRMRRQKTLWWYPPIVHVVMAEDPAALRAAAKKQPRRNARRAAIRKTAKGGDIGAGAKVPADQAGIAPVDPATQVANARQDAEARWAKFIAEQTKACAQPKPYYRYCVKEDFPRFRDKDLGAMAGTSNKPANE